MTSSQEELENRIRTLTDSLIHKQTVVEALSTEKNSLNLQLERLEVSVFVSLNITSFLYEVSEYCYPMLGDTFQVMKL